MAICSEWTYYKEYQEGIKKLIEEETGIPAHILTGETIEENISHAKAILEYKKQNQSEYDILKGTFKEWFNAIKARDIPDKEETLDNILEYSTEQINKGCKSPGIQFEEWLFDQQYK